MKAQKQTVEAVNEDWQLKAVAQGMQERGRIYGDIWRIGINTGLRISDLLSLTMDQVRDIDFELKHPELAIIEQKTGKVNEIRLNEAAQTVIQRRLKDHAGDTYLFQTESKRNREPMALNRRSVGRVLESVGKPLKLKLGTHSMRKTAGHYLHSKCVPIEDIAHFLNHRDPKVTMRYLGLTKQARAELFDMLPG